MRQRRVQSSLQERPRSQQGRRVGVPRRGAVRQQLQQLSFQSSGGKAASAARARQFEDRELHLSPSERLHFQQAERQLQRAIQLQACLANPALC